MADDGALLTVTIRCYGPARAPAGGDVVEVRVHPPATVADALAALVDRVPGLAAMVPGCATALGDELVDRSHVVHEHDEIALLPPVAGG